MTIEHAVVTDPAIHEPKGISTASSGQVYVANGSASGTWTSQTIPTGNFRVIFRAYTSSTTWTKPAGLIGVEYLVLGPGGASSVSTSSGSATFKGATANGGANSTPNGAGGVASGGDVNYTGASKNSYGIAFPGFVYGSYGQSDTTGTAGAGGMCQGWKRASDLSSTEAVTITNSVSNNNGFVLLKEYIQI